MLNFYQEPLKLWYHKKNYFFTFVILILIFFSTLQAQNTDSLNRTLVPDSLQKVVISDDQPMTAENLLGITDTVETSLWPALVRSAIVPGWGQIEQEHPGRAVIFYGLGLTFLYNIGYNIYWYNKTNSYANKVKIRRYSIFYLQLYAINLADVIESHRQGDDKPWPQDLFSDQPLKSPWGAVARSAMLPGWGQCYNESYIKSVIAFGSAAYFISRIVKYDREYSRTGDPDAKEKRSTNSWYLGLTYLIMFADAYVDAHLYRFDDMVTMTYNYSPEEKAHILGVQIVF